MSTLATALWNTAKDHGDSLAVIDPEGNFSWAEYIERVGTAAGLLQQLGLGQGQRYGILALNSWRQAEITHAGYWIGATPVPLNFRLAAPEIAEILNDASCQLIILDSAFAPLLESPELNHWKQRCIYFSASDDEAGKDYDRLHAEANPVDLVELEPQAEAILLYTGGTTGKAKGVPLSHANILANAGQIASAWSASSEDVVLHLPPMFHSAELVKTLYMLAGAASIYQPRFDPENLLQTIEKFRVSFVLMVPTIIAMLLESSQLEKYDLSSLRQIIYGASSMSTPQLKLTFAAFPGVEIAQGYGLTETAPLISMLDYQSHLAALESGNDQRLASCGRALDGVTIRIVDEQGRDVVGGDTGEILVKGKNVFAGYLNQAELNQEIFNDGWFLTGDVGYMDAEGYLYLKDRRHDLIMTGGEKVYSAEVEAVLYMHPAVSECAVIGTAHAVYGEQVHAIVVTAKDKSLTEAELIEHCRQHIGAYKLPRRVDMVESLPKSAMGKILKSELRKQWQN